MLETMMRTNCFNILFPGIYKFSLALTFILSKSIISSSAQEQVQNPFFYPPFIPSRDLHQFHQQWMPKNPYNNHNVIKAQNSPEEEEKIHNNNNNEGKFISSENLSNETKTQSRAILAGNERGGRMRFPFSDNESPKFNQNNEEHGLIHRCPKMDSESINICLKKVVEDLKPKLPDGIPEIDLPPMDPLLLTNISFKHGRGPIRIIATFTNVEATGLSLFNESKFVVDMSEKKLDFSMLIPQMVIIGNYELSGKLFFLPVGGSGTFWLHLDEITPSGHGKLETKNSRRGKELQMKSLELDLKIRGVKMHLTNLFNGDEMLGKVMNNFLNENSMEIFEELRPDISGRIAEMVQNLTNKALSAISPEHFNS